MSTKQSDKKWLKLVKAFEEGSFAGKPIFRNENQVLFALGKDNKSISSLVIFDGANNKFVELTKFDEALECRPDSITMDTTTDIAYIPGSAGIHKIDLKVTNTEIIW